MAVDPIMIYLAGPIDDVTPLEASGWRAEATGLVGSGTLFFDPSRAWHGVNDLTAKAVDMGNRHAIALADGLLANLSGPGRAFGTIREIEFARARNNPVAVVGQLDSLLAHDIMRADDLEEGLDLLLTAILRQRQNSPEGMVLGMFPFLRGPESEDE